MPTPSAEIAASLDRVSVEAALRSVIASLDYDLHKYIECDEETGEDTYPDVVDKFINAYEGHIHGLVGSSS